MTWKSVAAVLLSLVLISVIYADTVAHYTGTAGMISGGIDGKNAGDIISLMTDDAIAANCDFNRQIVVTRTSVLCVYTGKKQTQS